MKTIHFATIAMIVALLPMPYAGYYFIKIIVTTACAYEAYKIHKSQEENKHLYGLILIATLFNPLIPIWLTRESWIVIDIACAIYLINYAHPGKAINIIKKQENKIDNNSNKLIKFFAINIIIILALMLILKK